jgi:hypothetical protein
MIVSRVLTKSVVYHLSFLLLLLIPTLTQAATHVVTEGQSIADALAISAPGDSVLVGPGDYFEQSMMMASGVTLAALSSQPEEFPRLIGDSAQTILHCENLTVGTHLEGLRFVGAIAEGQSGPIRGHGIYVVNSAMVISKCSFQSMRASYGAAIYVGKGIAPNIFDCSFVDGYADASGGAVSLVGAQGLVLDQCLFEGNASLAGGSALNLAFQASATVVHCTFVDSDPINQRLGDIQAWDDSSVELENCIVANGSGRAIYGDFSSTPQLHCSDLIGNGGGDWLGAIAGQAEMAGNISLDPLFCGEDGDIGPFTLHEDSPCSAEANPECGIMGAFQIGCGNSAGTGGSEYTHADEDILPTVTKLRGNYPNPFNPQTTIAFDLSTPGHAAVDVYDLAGRLVRNLHSGVLAAGPHQVMWNGRGPDGRMSAAGVYFFRLKTEQVIDTQRMTLVK